MEEAQIPWSRLADFIRKHTHDVRNDLNSLELEATLLQDSLPEDAAQAALTRIRKQLRSLAEEMRLLSIRFQSATPMGVAPMPAKALLNIWKERHAALPDAPAIKWLDELEDEKIKVDVEMIASVTHELLVNAARFLQAGPATISARSDRHFVIFEMNEPRTTPPDMRHWGQPFFSTHHGSHGLGLWTARRLVEANRGTFTQRFDPDASVLITQIKLPRVA